MEAKAMVGKAQEEINFRKILKEKLKVTKIPRLRLEDKDSGEIFSFNDFYEFKKFLGGGSFGYVVSALDKESGEMMALKVSIFHNLHSRSPSLFPYIRFAYVECIIDYRIRVPKPNSQSPKRS